MKRIFILIFSLFLTLNFIAGQADLVLTTADFSPDQIDKGDIFSIQATVTNIGNVRSGSNYMFIYYTKDLMIEPDEIISRVSIKELAPGESQVVDFIYPISTTLSSGDYYLAFEVDPFDNVPESEEENIFCVSTGAGCITFNIRNDITQYQKFTYPIIFIHGLVSDYETWTPFLEKAKKYYGWSSGGVLDYCLNPDNNKYFSDTYILPRFSNSDLESADYYQINFDSDNSCIENNQSAVVKQGWAVSHAIEQVLSITKAEKVILVGHSMGGLAAREYIQNETNWQIDGKHHVAKILTIATPNGGSAVTGVGIGGLFLGISENSEAVRDLRYPNLFFEGQYLFGGQENAFSLYNNDDVNCDGDIGDNIIGLNYKPAPLDINYSCIFSNEDEVVDEDRADLNQYPIPQTPFRPIYADKFVVESDRIVHNNIHIDMDNYQAIIQGLDESNFYESAYPIPLNSLNYGFSTEQAVNNPFYDPNNEIDWDDYEIEIEEPGVLKVDILNIPVNEFVLYLLDENQNVLQGVFAEGKSNIGFETQIGEGKYYLELGSAPSPNSWRFPYAYSVLFTPISGLTADFSANKNEGCEPLIVNFKDESEGSPNSYSWTFPGGSPATSGLPNPTVRYNESGVYPVSLTVSNSVGSNSISNNGFITVKAIPKADFSVGTQLDRTVNFTNQTQFDFELPDYLWDFGDGNTGNAASPTHTYQSDGVYTVKLKVTNSCGSTDKTMTVDIRTVSNSELQYTTEFLIFPNPTQEEFTVRISSGKFGEIGLFMTNGLGQTIRKERVNKSSNSIDFNINVKGLPSGTYFVKMLSQKENYTKKVIIK